MSDLMGAIGGLTVGLGCTAIILIIVFLIFLPLILWITQMVRLSKRKNKTGFWAVLIIGLVLLVTGAGPLIGGIIGLFLGRGAEKFLCGVCYMKYEENLLGSESVHEGKICRFCPDKKLKRN